MKIRNWMKRAVALCMAGLFMWVASTGYVPQVWASETEEVIPGEVNPEEAAETEEVMPLALTQTTGTCGPTATWAFDENTGTLTISGSGEISDTAGYMGTWWLRDAEESDRLKKVIINEGITGIGAQLFSMCELLSEVTIPNSVTEIDREAFSGCKALSTITIPVGVTKIAYSTFYGCSNLESVIIPSGVTEIGREAFSGCAALREIILPSSLTKIGDGAFSACSKLESVAGGLEVTEIGASAFSGCVALKAIDIPSVTKIANSTFYGCSNLESVDFGIRSGITAIGSDAFHGCGALREIDIPSGVTRIDDGTFFGCSKLERVSIPSGVTVIGYGAFLGCKALRQISIPSGVTKIANEAFSACTSLNLIEFPGNAPGIESDAFLNVTANVLYPIDNATWTEAKRQNYGGKLTWGPFPGTPVVVETGAKIVPEKTDSVVGRGKDATIVCSAPAEQFINLYIDDQLVDKASYTVRSGSTIITILAAYLDKLEVGSHAVTLEYTFGKVNTVLTVVEDTGGEGKPDNGDEKSPKTGDDLAWELWLAMALAAGCVVLLKKRRI